MRRTLDAICLASILIAALYWTVPSTAFLRPYALSLEGARVTFVRGTPSGGVWARWTTEIRLLDTEQGVARPRLECSANGVSYYQPEPDDTVYYTIGAYATPCLDAGPPLVIIQRWRPMLFGVIPLRPIIRSYTQHGASFDEAG